MKTWIVNLKTLLFTITAVMAPVVPLLLTVGFLVVLDFIFAICKAIKLGEEITSRKMSHTVSKLTLYTLTIISIWFLERFILEGALPATKIAAGLISVVEIKSVDESFKKLFKWSLWEKMKAILNRPSSTTKDIFK